MTSSLTVRLMGITARIQFADEATPALVRAVSETWQDLIVASSVEPDLLVAVGPANDPLLDPDPDVYVPIRPEENFGERLASRLTFAALERMSGRALMLHASAVALDDGRVVGFSGPSGRGKTTSMTVLGHTYRYVTDETLAIAVDGSVIPYPKPLLIGHQPAVKTAYSATALGLRPLSDGELRLAALVLLDRREGYASPVVTEVPLVEAMVELVEQSSYFSALGHPLQTLATLIVSTGGVRRLTYSEAETLPAAFPPLLAASEAETARIASVDPLPPTEPGPETWTRAPYIDALRIDDRLVVLHDQTISVLEGIAPAVWTAAVGASLADLTRAALLEHPAPPRDVDPAAIVSSVVQELATSGLLRHA